MKDKVSKAVPNAFASIMDKRSHPTRLQTENCKELCNHDFAALMHRHDVLHIASESDQKATVVERFNHTIKSRI